MKKYFLLMLCCFLLLMSACSTKYQRIRLNKDAMGTNLANHISADTVVNNTVEATFPNRLPIYKISKHNVSIQEFQQMLQQLGFSDDPSYPYDVFKREGNKVYCNLADFTDFSRGYFDDLDMTEAELEKLAWDTFHKIPFLEGNYEYGGIRGKDTLSDSKGEHIARVCVSFYRLIDNIRVIGNERCNLWFDGSGLVAIDITLFDYSKTGTMDMVTLEDATAKIKTPDAFSIDVNNGVANTLQVDRIKLLLVNQYSDGCTILQPVYNFIGTATMEDGTQAEFSSKIIAIPESYTYESE